MSWALILEFIKLIPSFWGMFLRFQQERDQQTWEEYVRQREQIIAMLKGVNGDPLRAYEAAIACQRLLSRGK